MILDICAPGFVYLYHDPGAPFIINLRQGLIQKVSQICYQWTQYFEHHAVWIHRQRQVGLPGQRVPVSQHGSLLRRRPQISSHQKEILFGARGQVYDRVCGSRYVTFLEFWFLFLSGFGIWLNLSGLKISLLLDLLDVEAKRNGWDLFQYEQDLILIRFVVCFI